MERQEGYYWVKYQGVYFAALWHREAWFLPKIETAYNDDFFEEINENRILISVELIGLAHPSLKRGVICSSFNAG